MSSLGAYMGILRGTRRIPRWSLSKNLVLPSRPLDLAETDLPQQDLDMPLPAQDENYEESTWSDDEDVPPLPTLRRCLRMSISEGLMR